MLEKFIGLVICHGVISGRNWPVLSLWDKSWGCPIFSKTMPRDDFTKILKFLLFDLKTEQSNRLTTDKFCMASQLWEPFIKNCQKAYIPDQNITVDGQLLPCQARCEFIQCMANKPDKLFGLKFWLLVDVQSKYLCNGFPYLGRDETHNGDYSLPTAVVMKLVEHLANYGNYHSKLMICVCMHVC